MEPEGSLLCSQEPSVGPYPEPDAPSPCHPVSPRYILILSSHLRLGLLSELPLPCLPKPLSNTLLKIMLLIILILFCIILRPRRPSDRRFLAK
jgi:hypothetical protein